MGLYDDLQFRGILHQVTDEKLGQVLEQQKLTLYCGFDPTADSLHVGSLLPLMTLRRFQLAGHHVIAVVGGATGMIGDPSGKTAERSLLTAQAIAKNVEGITRVISRFLDLSGDNPARVMNNAQWTQMSFLDFLRDVGKHFTVNHMMAKESVRARLEDREHGISYTEFSYMLLQAYDYFVLNRDHGCALQIGGSDQWGNITAGGELIRRMRAAQGLEPVEAYGLTHPLVTRADGTKFGKTESGNLWLDPQRTSPYQFFQFFLNSADADVMALLKFFTFMPREELERLERQVKEAPQERAAQRALAEELTKLVHGEEELKKAQEATAALFAGGDLKSMSAEQLKQSLGEAPTTSVPMTELDAGLTLVDLLARVGLCGSKGAARKDIQGGGIYVNNERAAAVDAKVTRDLLLAGRNLVLRKGKKSYHLVVFEP